MQIKFCKFWHCDMHNWFVFCKFVIKIRHLSIKIIYASRTGQMIVLYNNIISIIQIKNQITTMLFVYISPVSIAISYKIYFALLDNVQFYPHFILPLSTGVFYILILYVRCWILGMRSILTYQPKPIPSKSISPPISHHSKIVLNPHTIHKSSSITTSTHMQNIPQPI